jgi:chromosomal replication initiation ATPase DnaA
MVQLIINDVEKIPVAEREAIERITRAAGAEPSYFVKTGIDCLLDAVQKVFRCTLDELKSNSKKNNLPYARHIYFYYARKMYPDLPQQEIGKMLNRCQPSVAYSIFFFQNENSRFNNEFRNFVAAVNKALGNE